MLSLTKFQDLEPDDEIVFSVKLRLVGGRRRLLTSGGSILSISVSVSCVWGQVDADVVLRALHRLRDGKHGGLRQHPLRGRPRSREKIGAEKEKNDDSLYNMKFLKLFKFSSKRNFLFRSVFKFVRFPLEYYLNK